MAEHGIRCDVAGLATTVETVGVDWGSGPDITAWIEATPKRG
jgi:hypothetical protein